MVNNPPTIVIIKKKARKSHAGHHGGAWKVAYADFITALMAFFLVMWIVGQSKTVKAAIAGYFRDPGVFEHQRGAGLIPAGATVDLPARRDPPPARPDSRREAALARTADRIRARLGLPEFEKVRDQIEIQITADGLRIELVDRSSSTFFDTGSAALKPQTRQILAVIASELGSLRSWVFLEGHTDSRQYSTSRAYTNWELSADRANAARREMEAAGLQVEQVREVRGFADTKLRITADPLDPRNRRVSISVTP